MNEGGDAAVYNSAIAEWRDQTITGRVHHASCCDGERIYLFGGSSGAVSYMQMPLHPAAPLRDQLRDLSAALMIYTPPKDSAPGYWKEVKPSSSGRPGFRKDHQLVTDGANVYLFGGFNEDSRISSKVYVFSIERSTWSISSVSKGTPPKCRNHSMAIFQNKIYVFGGKRSSGASHSSPVFYDSNQLDCYDLETKEWSIMDPLGEAPPPLSSSSMCAIDSKLYLFGGSRIRGDGIVHHDKLYSYDIDTKKWEKVATTGPSPRGRSSHGCASFQDGFWIAGGLSNGGVSDQDSTIYKFVPARMEWQILGVSNSAHGPLPRQGLTMEYLEGALYFIGGLRDNGSRLTGRYDVHTISVLSVSPSISSRYPKAVASSLSGMINKRQFSDITITVEGQEIYCHKVILAARSEYFRVLFDSAMKDATTSSLSFEEASHTAFTSFINFLYTGNIPGTATVDEAIELLSLAGRSDVHNGQL
eukprot:TRINITY_DN2613_c0_g1_i1.p1 TRINITY_DN2613_c0_g1~~TRINITY_DN2613_c0_g1_i1.p1  ORF type:complete len:473 (+),score=67.50 TRINITY_DN2613_c0_g1_i1:75-1493(+)